MALPLTLKGAGKGKRINFKVTSAASSIGSWKLNFDGRKLGWLVMKGMFMIIISKYLLIFDCAVVLLMVREHWRLSSRIFYVFIIKNFGEYIACIQGKEPLLRLYPMVACASVSVLVFLHVLRFVNLASNYSANDGTENFELNIEDSFSGAPVQASFRLQRPVSLLRVYTSRLEREILDEIGVPNTKVCLISMHPLDPSSWTYVVFGVLANRHDVPISPVDLSVLRSSLVELVLEHSNLSLTSSIFGQPSSFEVLKFPEDITVVPTQPASVWLIPEILFNFTLNSSVSQIQENLSQLKEDLKYGLQLRSYESVYVKVTNLEGSTLAPPVIVQSAVFSDAMSTGILPERLKQLAEAITGYPVKNLGLDHSVFGRVKQIQLSQCLEKSLGSLSPIPSLSPSPSHSPAPSPSMENSFSAPPSFQHPELSPSYSPVPSAGPYRVSPCLHCDASSPLSTPQNRPQHPLPPSLKSPAPSVVTVAHSPRHNPCVGQTISSKSFPKFNSDSPAASYVSPHAAVPPKEQPTKRAPDVNPDTSPSPAVLYGPSRRLNQKIRIASVSSSPASSPISSFPSSHPSGSQYN